MRPEAVSIRAAILAGGKSLRLGRDKATLELAGTPLALHVARALRDATNTEPLLISKSGRSGHPDLSSSHKSLGLAVVIDIFPQHCALSGLHAALTHAETDRVLVATCDQPFLELALLRELILTPGPLVIGRTGAPFHQPFPGVYSRGLLGEIEELLREGNLSFQRGLFRRVPPAQLPLRRVRELDPALRSYYNLNTPAAWLAAQSAG